MRTGLTKQEKTTDIWFDEKDPLIHIRTHNTDLKNRLTAYSRRFPKESGPCRGTPAFKLTGSLPGCSCTLPESSAGFQGRVISSIFEKSC